MSELVATLVLIVIAVIAAAAVLEYLESSSGNTPGAASSLASIVSSEGNQVGNIGGTAYVSATVLACQSSDGTCTLRLTNVGTEDADVSACAISGTAAATVSPNDAVIGGGESLQVECAASGATAPTQGTVVLGSVTLGNGAVVPWSGTWQ